MSAQCRAFRVVALFSLAFSPANAQQVRLDDFEGTRGWKAEVSDGAVLNLAAVPGRTGNALALDFEFAGGSGYVIARKTFDLTLPPNYRFSFYLRGELPVNNFEFKLLDGAGNVYWIKELDVRFPGRWTKKTVKKRHISFAWGPAGGGEISRVHAIEFVVSAGSGGGRGRLLVDDFTYEPMVQAPAGSPLADVSVSSSRPGRVPRRLPEGTGVGGWSAAGPRAWIRLDFGRLRELGGLTLKWKDSGYARVYDVELSDNGSDWRKVHSVRRGNGGVDVVPLPEAEARYLRVDLRAPAGAEGFLLDRLDVKEVTFSETPNALFGVLAREAPRGSYPRSLAGEQTYWTVVGVSGDTREALINTDGLIEVDRRSFSLEPFLFVDGRLLTWNDVTTSVSLDDGYLPVPSVHWTSGDISLTVRAFASGAAGRSTLIATYTLRNRAEGNRRGRLFVALRPFQVNPPWQSLNLVGGVAPVERIEREGALVLVDDTKRVIAIDRPDAFGATAFESGDIVEFLRAGQVPTEGSVRDRTGYASGAFAFDFSLRPGASEEKALVVPFHEAHAGIAAMSGPNARKFVASELEIVRRTWHGKLDRILISLPGSAQEIVRTIKSNMAYILINRDGPAIQPGSRSYERAWIRDGSLTSTALLQMGFTEEVKEYIDWYARYQYPSGKIPCVVDARGADPVPEHDSHGEFIYAVKQYFRFTGDTTWLRSKMGHVQRTVAYLQGLRRERKTDFYRTGPADLRVLYGLVPESISHEGYSARPMHSYWDNFFGIRGLKDAAAIAEVLGRDSLAAEWHNEVEDYRGALYSSIQLAMTMKGIDYIPGCAELGDFDATSTTIAVDPCGELGKVPEPALHNTFDRYYRFFTDRRDGKIDWRDYTPYEIRLIGTFVALGQTQRAHELTAFFLNDRRPSAWNQWAEVVWREPSTPRFIGDMPHTWVGSDFIRSVRSMLVYEREHDSALVVGAGIPEEWVNHPDGIAVRSLPTYHGVLGFNMRSEGEAVRVQIGGTIEMPAGKILLRSPRNRPIRTVLLNGMPYSRFTPVEVVLDRVPADLVLSYEQ